MRHVYDETRHNANNTLNEVNRHLRSGKIRNPKHHEMLTNMAANAMRTLKDLDARDDARPYSDTNIGYNTDIRQRRYANDDTNDVIRRAMDVVNKILPYVTDDFEGEAEMRRGVPGTGRYADRHMRTHADRYDNRYDVDERYDNDRYDMDDDRYDDDDLRVVNMPRWRSARTGRFLPNLYGPRGVRRVRRRAEMDNMDDRYNTDDRYSDRYDRYDDDARYDDIRRTADDARRIADDARRMADDARRTADESRNIYPGTPVMRGDRYDTRNDTRSDRRSDTRNDTDHYSARGDDETSDRTHRPGPRMRE